MQTIQTPDLELTRLREDNARLRGTRRSLIMALVIVLVAVAGAAGWLIAANAPTASERQISQLLYDYAAAWEANDGAGALALMTENGSITFEGETRTGDELTNGIDTLGDFSANRVGDLIIVDRSTYWMVAEAIEGGELSLFKVVQRDGRFLIQSHQGTLP